MLILCDSVLILYSRLYVCHIQLRTQQTALDLQAALDLRYICWLLLYGYSHCNFSRVYFKAVGVQFPQIAIQNADTCDKLHHSPFKVAHFPSNIAIYPIINTEPWYG